MRGKRWTVLLGGALLGAGLVAWGCGPSAPKEPENVVEARKLLEEAWTTTGPQGKWLVLGCLSEAPHIGFAKGKAETVLKIDSKQLRLDSAQELAAWDDEETIKPIFAKLLEDEDELTRLYAAKVLAGFGDDAGIDLLKGHIRDKDGNLNSEYCGLLSKLGDNECFEMAKKELTSKSDNKSAAAAATLAEIGGPEAAKVLRARLGNLHGARRAPAISALGLISEEPNDVPLILSYFRYKENVLAVIDALGDMGGEKAVAKLKKTLAVEDPLARTHAAGALAKLGVLDEEVLAALEDAVASDSVKIRYDAANLLAVAKPDPAVAKLLGKLAADDDPKVALQALRGLEEQVTAEQMPDLQAAWEKIKDAPGGAGYEASMKLLSVVTKVPGEDAESLLTETLKDQNWGRAVQAAIGIVARYEKDHPPAPTEG